MLAIRLNNEKHIQPLSLNKEEEERSLCLVSEE